MKNTAVVTLALSAPVASVCLLSPAILAVEIKFIKREIIFSLKTPYLKKRD